ncbi:hypothetical protein [Candidatus Neptunochlamydia vexilliferae]|uniref:Uncharacterized protein n=1 Tax=Candidatus Neptunichlamydia vexilliferae TaxID=1651774 RepID=A0ABS0AY93_9BACT|nr:hypothetical protein [Candidatus Neptunochlamydia vexilliferae]MBF5059097.1 hypothetical protein [Candidatus Neptunochlamydia vexilliferae]
MSIDFRNYLPTVAAEAVSKALSNPIYSYNGEDWKIRATEENSKLFVQVVSRSQYWTMRSHKKGSHFYFIVSSTVKDNDIIRGWLPKKADCKELLFMKILKEGRRIKVIENPASETIKPVKPNQTINKFFAVASAVTAFVSLMLIVFEAALCLKSERFKIKPPSFGCRMKTIGAFAASCFIFLTSYK